MSTLSSIAIAAALTAAAALPAHAVLVVQWNFEDTTTPPDLSNSTASPAAAASLGSGTASGLHASAATDWSTPAGNGSANSFSVNTWGVGDYWQFSFSTVGYTGLTLSFDQTSSSTGPLNFFVSVSGDGVNFTDAYAYEVLANGAAPNAPWSAVSGSAAYGFSFDLTGYTQLDDKATVAVRLVNASTSSAGGGSIGTGGTNRVDNFSVMLTPVPEPTTWGLMLAGLSAVGFVARRRG